MYVFSSARVLRSYRMDQLVRLGIAWVWMGLEGEDSSYQKLKDIDTRSLVKLLQSHGIRVLGSSIIGMENHTPENIHQVIDYAVGHETDFHQFMLYTPNPGTPLYEQHHKDGTLLPEAEFPVADAHGQYRFNYRHRHIHDGLEEQFLTEAFRRDFEVNGPSLARMIRTLLNGWQRYRNHPDKEIRNRFAWEVKPLRTTHAAAVWAMKKWYRDNESIAKKMDSLLGDIYKALGWKTRMIAPLVGRALFTSLKKEEKRLADGWSYEPDSFYEKNAAALAIEDTSPTGVTSDAPHAPWVAYEPSLAPGK